MRRWLIGQCVYARYRLYTRNKAWFFPRYFTHLVDKQSDCIQPRNDHLVLPCCSRPNNVLMPCSIPRRSLFSQDTPTRTPIAVLRHEMTQLSRVNLASFEHALNYISQQTERSLSADDGLFLLRCCGTAMPEATADYKQMQMNRILDLLNQNSDIRHYNALLLSYLENDVAFSPVQILKALSHRGLQPDQDTYVRLIAKYCHVGDFPAARTLKDLMSSGDTNISKRIYDVFVFGYAKAKNVDAADRVLEVMKNSQVSLKSSTFLSYAAGLAASGELRKSNEMLERALTVDAAPPIKSLFRIVRMLGRHGHHVMISELLPRIYRVCSDTHAYALATSNLLLEFAASGSFDAAFAVFLCLRRPFGVCADSDLDSFLGLLLKYNCSVAKARIFCSVLEQRRLCADAADRWRRISSAHANVQPGLRTFGSLPSAADYPSSPESGARTDRSSIYSSPSTHSSAGSLNDRVSATAPMMSLSQAAGANCESPAFKERLGQIGRLVNAAMEYAKSLPDHGSDATECLAKAARLLSDLDSLGADIPVGCFVSFCHAHARLSNCEKAVFYYDAAWKKSQGALRFSVQCQLELALALLKNGRHKDVMDLFVRHRTASPKTPTDDETVALVGRLLRTADRLRGPALVGELSDCLIRNNVVEPLPKCFAPAILACLQRNDLSAAVTNYVQLAQKHNIMAATVALFTDLIKARAPQPLVQKVFDAAEGVGGRLNALLTLAMCFIDLGRVDAARLLLANEQLVGSSDKLHRWCEYFLRQKKIELMKLLVHSTKLSENSLEVVACALLTAYKTQNDWRSALDVFERFRQLKIKPSQRITQLISALMRANGQPMPVFSSGNHVMLDDGSFSFLNGTSSRSLHTNNANDGFFSQQQESSSFGRSSSLSRSMQQVQYNPDQPWPNSISSRNFASGHRDDVNWTCDGTSSAMSQNFAFAETKRPPVMPYNSNSSPVEPRMRLFLSRPSSPFGHATEPPPNQPAGLPQLQQADDGNPRLQSGVSHLLHLSDSDFERSFANAFAPVNEFKDELLKVLATRLSSTGGYWPSRRFVGFLASTLQQARDLPGLQQLQAILARANPNMAESGPLLMPLLQLQMQQHSYVSGQFHAFLNNLEAKVCASKAFPSYCLLALRMLANVPDCCHQVHKLLMRAAEEKVVASEVFGYAVWVEDILAGRYQQAEELLEHIPYILNKLTLQIAVFCEAARSRHNEACLRFCLKYFTHDVDVNRKRIGYLYSYIIGIRMDKYDLQGATDVVAEALGKGKLAPLDLQPKVVGKLRALAKSEGVRFPEQLWLQTKSGAQRGSVVNAVD